MELSKRQMDVAARVAKDLPNKQIAHELGLSIKTVANHIQDAAQRLPGRGRPRYRIAQWFFALTGKDD
jgi:DNA-binding CsgD family transcriptional regulator